MIAAPRRGLFALALCAGACATPSAAAPADLVAALRELVARPELVGGRIGVVVADAGDGRTLVDHEADRGLATASNMKLVSAAVALSALGPDATTRTDLLLRGAVSDGEFVGDVVLRGQGDPTFGEDGGAALARFGAALRERGITRVSGRVLGDGSWLGRETLGLGWQWDYLDDDYAAPFGGLCCAGNVATVHVRPHDSGTPVVRCTPNATATVVDVRQVAAGAATRLSARRALGSPDIEVRGEVAADAKEQVLRVAVADPAAAAAAWFTASLAASGLAVDARQGPAAAGSDELVASHVSPPLAKILVPLLRDSNNLYAEQVWRWAARVRTGDGSTAAAERHAKAVLAELGVDPRGMVLADGSGLSRRNLVQPRQLAGLLLAMHRASHRDAFVAGLPVAGASGTLRSRFADGPARGRVRAKTGYISRVVCLSGYVERPDPAAAPLVFVVMLNDFTCDDAAAKAAVDAFVQRLAAFAGWPVS